MNPGTSSSIVENVEEGQGGAARLRKVAHRLVRLLFDRQSTAGWPLSKEMEFHQPGPEF